MSETFEEYRKRVLSYLGNRDANRVLRATPARLARLIHRVLRRRLIRRPAPEKWSVVEILAHLVDTEIAFAWRIRNSLSTPGVGLLWFNQDVWASRLAYQNTDPRESIVVFRALRRRNLALLESIPRRRWRTFYGVHSLRGRQTLAEFVQMEAAHDLNHIRQIEDVLSGGPRS